MKKTNYKEENEKLNIQIQCALDCFPLQSLIDNIISYTEWQISYVSSYLYSVPDCGGFEKKKLKTQLLKLKAQLKIAKTLKKTVLKTQTIADGRL